MTDVDEGRMADGLAALGNRTRLRLYKVLVRAGEQGLSVNDIKSRINVPSSTLAHHLATLTQAQLIRQVRHGRMVVSTANYPMMHELLDYLTSECCTGFCLTRDDEAA